MSARINLVYVTFFIIEELSVRRQQEETAKQVGIALFQRSIGSQMESSKENSWMAVEERREIRAMKPGPSAKMK